MDLGCGVEGSGFRNHRVGVEGGRGAAAVRAGRGEAVGLLLHGLGFRV